MEQLPQLTDWGLWANIVTVLVFVGGVLGWLYKTGRWIFRKPEPPAPPPPPEPPIRIGVPTGRPVLGRDADVAEIRAALLADHGEGVALVNSGAVLAGQGGIGKSTLARHYAKTHEADYHGILWTLAETRQEAITGLCGLSNALGLPTPDQPEIQHAHAVVAKIARSGKNWLIVFDNVETRADIDDLIPEGAHVIVTTRQGQGWDGFSTRQTDILGFDAPDAPAVRVLMDAAGRDEGAEDARALAEDLGGLPLALVVMGAFLRDAEMSFSEGRGALDAILDRAPQNAGYPNSVLGAVRLSYERLGPDARIVAQLCAFWAAEGLGPMLLLEAPAGQNWEAFLDLIPDEAQALAQDAPGVRAAFDELAARSLLTGAGETREMHRMTAAALRGLDEGAMASTAVALLAAVYPGGDRNPSHSPQWPLCARLTPHVQALLAGGAAPEVAAWDYLLNQAGIYLDQIADYQGRLPMARESLRIKRARLAEDHRNIAVAHANLGVAFQRLGRFNEAEAELTRAVALHEAHRPGSADLASAHDLLGLLLLEIAGKGAPERLPEAARRHQQALALRRELFGRRSAPVALALNNLGGVRSAQGRGRAAARLYGAALAIWRAVLPASDARLAHGALNSGAMWLMGGAAEKAEPLLREALEIREAAFAAQPQHPDRRDAADWLIACLLTRARAGVNRGAKEAEAKRLCAQYGFDFKKRQSNALQYPTAPKIGVAARINTLNKAITITYTA
ncbi:tetratricopeptide repeat protein [Pikeienuella piscinae]|uniref:Tetratricopeptide repeat protein n=1 Tax=Pikeienuella piscinae TaxID=2748098 RepID=A0A7L5BUL5_9RHOB|nr:tetratricopeptide repeat protein [Pikeienuella piscinae]QIE54703.1 tetratricopeptide repeat protein [Pikeienuella piscinae]